MTRAPTPAHVLELVDAACDEALAEHVIAIARALRAADVRVSAICHHDLGIAGWLRAGGLTVVEAPLGDYPCWRTVQEAAAWVEQEEVDVLHAHGGGAHALGAIVGAVTERPVLASIRGEEFPMLDLEAHRLGPWSHLAIDNDRAWRQAAALGVARARMSHVQPDAQATADLLARLASGGVVDGSAVVARRRAGTTGGDGARLR